VSTQPFCEVVEETGLPLTIDDFTKLHAEAARVPLFYNKYQFVYVCAAFLQPPYVTSHIHTPSKVVNAQTTQSIAQHDRSYVGARRHRSGGGPGGGCACRPVGIP
jgi:hypothetical protein